jgi:hypothetical protein
MGVIWFPQRLRGLTRASVTVLVLVSIAAGSMAVFHGMEWWSREQLMPKIRTYVDTGSCAQLAVVIENQSTQTIEHTSVQLSARPRGLNRNSDVTTGDRAEFALIIPPGESVRVCAEAPVRPEEKVLDPRSLMWSVRNVTYRLLEPQSP